MLAAVVPGSLRVRAACLNGRVIVAVHEGVPLVSIEQVVLCLEGVIVKFEVTFTSFTHPDAFLLAYRNTTHGSDFLGKGL